MNLYAALFRSTDSDSVNRNGVDACLADEPARNKGSEIREHRQKRLPDSTFCLVLLLYHFCGIVPSTRRKQPRILPVGSLPLDRRGFLCRWSWIITLEPHVVRTEFSCRYENHPPERV